MNTKHDEINLIDMLREKAEEKELSHELKTIFGGYTKKSVHDYINFIKQQQQRSNETFEINLQSLFAEKELIQNDNNALIARLNKVETSYDLLFNNVKNLKFVDTEYNGIDFYNFKITIQSLEKQLKEMAESNNLLEEKFKELSNEIIELSKKLL
ncbi:MAG: hypothetical protein K0Q97_1814 [Bacillota bacterium]|nr:hypothetical protein [Bacillota bacterium]